MTHWTDDLHTWPIEVLERLAGVLKRATGAPPSELALEAAVGPELSPRTSKLLAEAVKVGFDPVRLALLLSTVATARTREARRHRVDLVWSHPQDVRSRHTDAVIAELAASAEHELLLSTMSIGHSQGPNPALVPIAERLVEVPDLRVRLFVNVPSASGKGEPYPDPKRRFLNLMKRLWPPGPPLPEIWFAPMSLIGQDLGVLHAKCVVADRRRAFVTSANLTDAAQWRNIEAGALIHDSAFAERLAEHFDQLVSQGLVERLG